MRFFVSFLRVDSTEPLLGLTMPQLVSLAVIGVTVPLLVYFLRRQEPERRWVSPTERLSPSRAERRRRLRTGS